MSYTYTELKNSIKDYTENQESSFVSHLSDFIKSTEQRIFTTVDLEFFRKNVTGSTSTGNQFLAMPTDFLAAFSLSITNSSNKIFLQQKDVNYLQEFNPDNSTGIPRYYAVFDYENFILSPVPNANFTSELHYYYRPESLTASTFELTLSSVSGTFANLETITGGTSGATTTINSGGGGSVLTVVIPSADFTVGETVTGGTSGATGTVVSTSADTRKTFLSENAPNTMLYGCLVEAYTYMKGEKDIMDLYNGRFVESLGRLKDLAEARENTDAYRTGLPTRPRT